MRDETVTTTTKRKTAKTVTKTYIDVAYGDRDLAKRLGARWDASVKRWYCPAGSTLALIYKWRRAATPGEVVAASTVAPVAANAAPASVKTSAETAKPRVAKAPARSARISRMPTRRAPSAAPIAGDLFADLPLAG